MNNHTKSDRVQIPRLFSSLLYHHHSKSSRSQNPLLFLSACRQGSVRPLPTSLSNDLVRCRLRVSSFDTWIPSIHHCALWFGGFPLPLLAAVVSSLVTSIRDATLNFSTRRGTLGAVSVIGAILDTNANVASCTSRASSWIFLSRARTRRLVARHRRGHSVKRCRSRGWAYWACDRDISLPRPTASLDGAGNRMLTDACAVRGLLYADLRSRGHLGLERRCLSIRRLRLPLRLGREHAIVLGIRVLGRILRRVDSGGWRLVWPSELWRCRDRWAGPRGLRPCLGLLGGGIPCCNGLLLLLLLSRHMGKRRDALGRTRWTPELLLLSRSVPLRRRLVPS